MTAVLGPPPTPVAAPRSPGMPPRPRGRRGRSPRLPPGWPLVALLLCYPLWWALGLPTFIYAIAAVPMAFHLYRRGNVRVPPGFGLWLLLLAWVALSGLMLGQVAPDTMAPQGFGRFIGYGTRVMNYTALTVIMLYVLNLEEHELPRLRVVRLLGVMGLFTVVGGYVGVLFPELSFSSPLKELLPASLTTDPFVQRLLTVEVAQVQDVLAGGSGEPRPSAPFEYTNTWGENMCILLVWLTVGWTVLGRGARRVTGVVVLLAAVVPIVQSLNRGLWIGLGIAAVYVAVRLAWRGRFAPLGGLAAAVGLFAVLTFATPLGTVVSQRLDNGHSDDIRATLNAAAVKAAASSPILGYGANRPLIGSSRSIAIGKRVDCPQCGNREIGSDGQLWHLLIAQGFVGAFAYSGFFLWNLWRFRHDHTPIGIGGSLVLILVLFFQFLYGALNSTLCWALISVALLARNDRELRRQRMSLLGAGGWPAGSPGRANG
ncbi:MAG TPA: O-antigen ligase domain-containing protein [Micromonosporaceae bacterium]|nr:O-antigen ligase domain-containing protein [Micromonosporaceae bacterium]